MGQVRVTIGPDRHEVATIGQGGYFGEMSLLTGDPRTATVSAVSDCRVVEITAAGFREIALQNPAVLDAISADVARRRAELSSARTAAATNAVAVEPAASTPQSCAPVPASDGQEERTRECCIDEGRLTDDDRGAFDDRLNDPGPTIVHLTRGAPDDTFVNVPRVIANFTRPHVAAGSFVSSADVPRRPYQRPSSLPVSLLVAPSERVAIGVLVCVARAVLAVIAAIALAIPAARRYGIEPVAVVAVIASLVEPFPVPALGGWRAPATVSAVAAVPPELP